MTYPRAPVDRDEIERPSFPTVRRGYDAAAVDEQYAVPDIEALLDAVCASAGR